MPAFGPLTAPDAAAIACWVASQQDVTLFAGPDLEYPLEPEGLLGLIGPRYRTWVLAEAGRPVATGSLTFKPDAARARLCRILVDPARRGEGWGRRITEFLIARALDEPWVATLELGVYVHNRGAVALYRSLGFDPVGEPEDRDVVGESWTILQLERPASP
jgi:ribosomal protein S18 acetylase RimI-like enzyme